MNTENFIKMLDARINEELQTVVLTEEDVAYNQGYVQALRDLKLVLEHERGH